MSDGERPSAEPGGASHPVEDLVEQALDALERDGARGVDRLLAEHPERAERVRKRLRWLVDSGLAGSGVSLDPAPQVLGDFELLEPLGQGGMGVVYRARQRSLGREVALKLVRPEHLLFPGQLERFRREIAVVAGLSHPGIVPIYAVGEERGAPYFAMERVRGASLGDVLDRLAATPPARRTGRDLLEVLDELGADQEEPPSQLFDGDWPTVCARIVREAAEALEYAHRRGIVHRDVKPSNLMLTRGGRVLWVDFGLASDAGGSSSDAQGRLTRTGVRVGTAAYMSPEQLRGERAVGPASDVYSLGVTLYELLAARLPFDERDLALRERGDWAPLPRDLRRRDPRVARELETVVQAAAEHDPQRRYSSAADFARDLSHVLAGRPIEARRASSLELAARWVRRHPAWTVAAVLTLAAPSLLAWREARSRAQLAEKNAAIERSAAALAAALSDVTAQRDAVALERARAEQSLARAHDAVERMLSHVGGEALVDSPRTEPIRRALLEDALRLEEQLLAEPATTREQRARHAATLQRCAAIRAELGQYDAAFELLEKQARVLDALLAQGGAPELELARALCEARSGEALKLRGELRAARERTANALERFDALRAGGVPSASLVRAHAKARLELAEILAREHVSEGRSELLLRTVEDLAPLAAAPEATWELRLDHARALHALGATPHSLVGMVSSVRNPTEDVRWLERALAAYDELAAERPGHPSCLRREAEARVELALRRMQLRDLDGSAREYDKAITTFEQLVRDFPSRPMHADSLASACYNRSLIAAMQGDAAARDSLIRRSLALYEKLAANGRLSPAVARNHAIAWAQFGDALGAGDEARAAFERSLELGEPLLPHDVDGSLRRALAWTASSLAGVELELGDPVACARSAERMAGFAPRPIDTVWASSWFARAADHAAADDALAAERDAWRERAFMLLEQLAPSALSDESVRAELADTAFDGLRDHARFQALLDAPQGGR